MRKAIGAAIAGGVFVGTLDVFVASILFHVPPGIVLKSIAGGLLGRAAFHGGADVEVLGYALQLFICVVAAGTYVMAGRRWPTLLERPLVCGLAFGIGFYVVMTCVVVPLSRAYAPPFSWPMLAIGLADHMFLIGLPIAFIAHWMVPMTRTA